jgi:hypothetical protein
MKFLIRFYSKLNDLLKLHYKDGDFGELPFSRFLTCDKKHFSRSKSIVKQGAFLPPKNGRLSIYDIQGLNIAQIIKGPRKVFELLYGKKALGYAEINGNQFSSIDLLIDYNNFPHRHANVIDWPEEKEIQKEKALELACNSILRKLD